MHPKRIKIPKADTGTMPYQSIKQDLLRVGFKFNGLERYSLVFGFANKSKIKLDLKVNNGLISIEDIKPKLVEVNFNLDLYDAFKKAKKDALPNEDQIHDGFAYLIAYNTPNIRTPLLNDTLSSSGLCMTFKQGNNYEWTDPLHPDRILRYTLDGSTSYTESLSATLKEFYTKNYLTDKSSKVESSPIPLIEKSEYLPKPVVNNIGDSPPQMDVVIDTSSLINFCASRGEGYNYLDIVNLLSTLPNVHRAVVTATVEYECLGRLPQKIDVNDPNRMKMANPMIRKINEHLTPELTPFFNNAGRIAINHFNTTYEIPGKTPKLFIVESKKQHTQFSNGDIFTQPNLGEESCLDYARSVKNPDVCVAIICNDTVFAQTVEDKLRSGAFTTKAGRGIHIIPISAVIGHLNDATSNRLNQILGDRFDGPKQPRSTSQIMESIIYSCIKRNAIKEESQRNYVSEFMYDRITARSAAPHENITYAHAPEINGCKSDGSKEVSFREIVHLALHPQVKHPIGQHAQRIIRSFHAGNTPDR